MPSFWLKLTRLDRLVLALTLLILIGITVPQLPPGICFGDEGDLQLASTTLGIMHPPGYTGYVTLGYLLTRVPGVDPAYMVSLGCLASGVAALWLCILLQIRLGTNALIACAIGLALAHDSWFRRNLLAPEVYAPSLFFVTAAAYVLMRYARFRVERDLFLAAALLGFALANRPPVLLCLPFFLISWWFVRNRPANASQSDKPSTATGKPLQRFILVLICGLLPSFYAVGYLWVKDRPDTPYNYIEQYNEEFNELPKPNEGWSAKIRRIAWHMSARQFAKYMGNTWTGVKGKLHWLRVALLPNQLPSTQLLIAAVIVLGAIITYRRCPLSVWLLGGMMFGSVVFVCAYRIYGQAANLLPFVLAAGVFGGVAFSPLFPQPSGWMRQTVAAVILLTLYGASVHHALRHPRGVSGISATSFLEKVDMKSLPPNAVICSTWTCSLSLWYAKNVLAKRPDIDIVNAQPDHWLQRIRRLPGRPVFVTAKTAPLEGLAVTPYRNLWRLERDRREVKSP